MKKINNKKDVFRATDEEIREFFKATRFRGTFTPSINPKEEDRYCGKITNISINGVENDLCPMFLNVSIKFKQYIKEGHCEFVASVNLAALRSERGSYRLYPYYFKNIVINETSHFNEKEEAQLRYNLRLEDNLFIGLFTKNSNGSFSIRDIRRSDFSKLTLQNGKEQRPIIYHPQNSQLQDGKYYEFSWLLKGVQKENYIYFFEVNEERSFKEISAYDIVSKINNVIMKYPADSGDKIVKMLDTLKTQLTASGRDIFIYELLQNANDYPVNNGGVIEKVDVEFHILNDSLIFMHSGEKFNERNVAAICGINEKEKTDNKDAIGYKGIGFKTVFLDNNYVYLQTGDFSFRFDKEKNRDVVATPWQILPIWTNYKELTPTERYIFSNANEKHQVKFSLHPRNVRILKDDEHNYIKLFHNVFENERVILFIPNLASVKVFYNGNSIPKIDCRRDSEKWRVDEFKDNISEDITESINKDIVRQEDTGSLKIPAKYYDFERTKVSFACEIEGAQLKPVKDTLLYCYLPTRASWGFNFLMNTDMIPTGPRDDIEIDFTDQININAELSEIAGRKFFDWINKLCETQLYKATSIFSLIPNFEICQKEHRKYSDLIQRFRDGFDLQIEERELIPININEYALLKETILDNTGLMSSGIMTDQEFYDITGINGLLPITDLRGDQDFESFQKKYLKKLDKEENIWTVYNLVELCSDSGFQDWLLIDDNNNKFLQFLIKKKHIDSFWEKSIFIDEVSGTLKKAEELFYDIDEPLEDLSGFVELMPHLSLQTRNFFNADSKWEEAISNRFFKFDANYFISNTLLSENFYTTKSTLNNKQESIGFYSFLAKNNIFNDEIKDLPFINDQDEVVDGFADHLLFFSSEYGHRITSNKWLNSVSIKFISTCYDQTTLKYFSTNLEINDFTDEIIIRDVVLNDNYISDINNSIQKDKEINVDFVNYCFKNREHIEMGELRNFALHVFDKDGDESYTLSEENIYFPSSKLDYYLQKSWIQNSWMFCLDEVYLKNNEDIQSSESLFKEFLSKKFYVKELSEKLFYEDIVFKNISDILESISSYDEKDKANNIDFVKYLDDNYELIYNEKKDHDIFISFECISNDGLTKIHLNKVYLYNEELKDIHAQDWLPDNTFYLASSEYGQSKALMAIGARAFVFSDFYNHIIVEELESINNNITDKETSAEFHNCIISNINYLSTNQLHEMRSAKIFLYGNAVAAKAATGHKILSNKAKELFDKGLVEFSHLGLIDPVYKTEQCPEYWEDRLENSKFTQSDFFRWLKNNVGIFTKTIENRALNIAFWRWLKEDMVSDKNIQELPYLPILLKNEEFVISDETIYFANEYMGDYGIESIVTKYDEEAYFITSKYVEENESIDEWKIFWQKIGISYDIVDILVNTVIPRLSDIEDETLPAILTQHKERLEKKFDNRLLSQLSELRVIAKDGEFYDISETVYINSEKQEPFKYISFPNQISFSSIDERRLIKEISSNVGGTIVDSLTEWQQQKIDLYIEMQDNDENSINNIHYNFINELSILLENDAESFKNLKKINEIFLLDKAGNYTKPTKLTMGSVYKPFFDFEFCGIDTFNYVSDSYSNNCEEYVGRLFRKLEVHTDFKKTDIECLNNRECAIYFWSVYLKKKSANIKSANITRIQKIIEDGLLNDIACIPTKDFMKCPNDLYSITISNYVKQTDDSENKLPLETLPSIELSDGDTLFSKLPFKESLDFLDALNALFCFKTKKRRPELLRWMIENYNKIYDSKVKEYRRDEHSVWYNAQNEEVQIEKLYALDHNNSQLDQYFGANPRIINRDFFPSGDLFKKACDILGVKTIMSDDLIMDPIAKTSYKQKDTDLKLFALVIAGIEDNQNWKSRYDDYCQKLSALRLFKCSSISITYKDDKEINQRLRKFYHETNTDDFYFVESLDSKRVFNSFVEEISKYLSFIAADDLIEEIMDCRENAIEKVKEQNVLMLDKDFKNEIDKLIPGIKNELNGKEALDFDQFRKRHTHLSPIRQEREDEPHHDQGGNENEDLQPENGSEVADSDLSNGTVQREGYSSINQLDKGERYDSVNRGLERTMPQRAFPISNLGSKGVARTLETSDATVIEISDINDILGEDMTPEQIADQNYLIQLRLYQYLLDNGLEPNENKEEFLRNNGDRYEHTLLNGKYIHKCSAINGIMYLSPSIWNKVTENNCVVCVYVGHKANDFMLIKSREDIIKWISEDDIIIKLTGEEKINIVDVLYSGVLNKTKGTAYTMLRVNSNERYRSIFAPIENSNTEINENDY